MSSSLMSHFTYQDDIDLFLFVKLILLQMLKLYDMAHICCSKLIAPFNLLI